MNSLTTEIRDLNALVDNVLAIHGTANFLDHTEATLRGYLAPELFLADALSHLANKRMDSGDQDAWWKIKGIQECLFSGLTDLCACCGRMEGDHGNFTNLCPDAKGTFSRPLVEFEGYFRSQEFVSNALGLRRELEKLAAPTHCQANVTQGSWDPPGHECGKKVVPGSEFCEEHAE